MPLRQQLGDLASAERGQRYFGHHRADAAAFRLDDTERVGTIADRDDLKPGRRKLIPDALGFGVLVLDEHDHWFSRSPGVDHTTSAGNRDSANVALTK